jgi:8-oxo-dGTP diphosphatase
MNSDKRFNVRAYGIYISEGRLLVTDEYRMGIRMTKFPGGGVEFGEGLADCIMRECIEEFGQPFRVLDHFYTTDFFQPSAFNPAHQLISVYFLVEPEEELKCKVTLKPFEFERETEGAQCFRWISLKDLSEDHFTFPVDKIVVEMIKKKFN